MPGVIIILLAGLANKCLVLWVFPSPRGWGRMKVRGAGVPAGILPASWVKAGAAGWLCGAWPAPGTTRALLPEQESCFMLWFY